MTDVQQVSVSFSAVSAAGNPAQVENATVTSSDESVLTVVENNGVFTLVTTGKLGLVQVVVEADALIGEGVESLLGTADVEVVASKAVKIDVAFGVPEDKVIVTPVDPVVDPVEPIVPTE